MCECEVETAGTRPHNSYQGVDQILRAQGSRNEPPAPVICSPETTTIPVCSISPSDELKWYIVDLKLCFIFHIYCIIISFL